MKELAEMPIRAKYATRDAQGNVLKPISASDLSELINTNAGLNIYTMSVSGGPTKLIIDVDPDTLASMFESADDSISVQYNEDSECVNFEVNTSLQDTITGAVQEVSGVRGIHSSKTNTLVQVGLGNLFTEMSGDETLYITDSSINLINEYFDTEMVSNDAVYLNPLDNRPNYSIPIALKFTREGIRQFMSDQNITHIVIPCMPFCVDPTANPGMYGAGDATVVACDDNMPFTFGVAFELSSSVGAELNVAVLGCFLAPVHTL